MGPCPDNMTPCRKAILLMRRRLHRGGYLHLLQAPFGAAAAIEHRPNVMFQSGVVGDAAQAQYWLLHSWWWQGGQCVLV